PNSQPLPPFPTRRSSDLRGYNTTWILDYRSHNLVQSPRFKNRVCVDNADVCMGREVQAAIQRARFAAASALVDNKKAAFRAASVDRKSTRLNSSHQIISY